LDDERTKKVDEVSADVWGSVEDIEYSVKIVLEGSELSTLKLKAGENLIGRMPENDIMIDDPEVSRSHARIILENGSLVAEDLQSENGISVNGKKIQIKDVGIGDIVKVGAHELIIEGSGEYAQNPELSDQIKKAEAQEWRLDQTIAAASPEMQKKIMEQVTAKRKAPEPYGTMQVNNEEEQEKIRERIKAKADDKQDSKKIDLSFNFQGKSFNESLEFDFIRPIDPKREATLEDAIYVNIKVGNVMMGKKIKL